MMDQLKNAIRSEILRALSQARAQTRAGTISSYDPATHMAKVTISPELVETGWLQILAAGVGSGFGVYVGPSIGDQVIVLHLEDDFGSGMIVGRVCDDDHLPPVVPSGEMWAVHKTGSFLKFLSTGDVALSTENDLIATVGNNLNVTVGNDVNISGSDDLDITVDGDVSLVATGTVVIDGDEVLLGGDDAVLAVKLSDGSDATKVKAK